MPAAITSPDVSQPPVVDAAAEAARYALLRRLAPAIRHHLVVHLQPIGMIYEVMDRRLRASTPDLANVHDSAAKISRFARAALDSCLDVVTWLAPDEGVLTPLAEGAAECAALLGTGLSFRGYALRNEVAVLPCAVRRSAVRNVLSALVLHATDELPPPAELILTAEAAGNSVMLTLQLRPTEGGAGFYTETHYRAIGWADVHALAAADSVELRREEPLLFRIGLACVPATTLTA